MVNYTLQKNLMSKMNIFKKVINKFFKSDLVREPKFEGHYREWRATRLRFLNNYFGANFFKNKKILELGGGYGDLGISLWQQGAKITITDARQEHLDEIIRRYPKICNEKNVFRLDLENAWTEIGEFDVIIHFGVLYHLKNWELSLRESILRGKFIFLETEVSDFKENRNIIVEEKGYDQAFSGIGSRPSVMAIERVIDSTGAKYKRHDSSILNSTLHTYDWEGADTKSWRHGLRRFWVIQNL